MGAAVAAPAAVGVGSEFLAFLGANPLISAMSGIEAALGIRDLLTESPADRAAKMQMGVMQQLIPQLQAAARGEPTAATQAQMGQLRQQATRMGQSYAASAQRSGIAGTTPSRAQQGRLQAGQLQAQGDILGRAQQAATQQLLGMGAQGLQAQQQQEAVRFSKKQALLGDLGDFMAWYKQNQRDEQADRFKTALFNWLGISV